jgi:hypothetical protein
MHNAACHEIPYAFELKGVIGNLLILHFHCIYKNQIQKFYSQVEFFYANLNSLFKLWIQTS